jgi:hypothetical protein
MATFSTSPGEQPPPDLPVDPEMRPQLANYLRTFALWCRNGFRAKLDSGVALPGILLQAYDTPPGTTPTVWLLQVNHSGTFVATQIGLGGGKP